MPKYRKYMRRSDTAVTAVQITLDTDGFTYRKWGGEQTARAGDWLLNREGEAYTVDRSTFEATYRQVSPGVYEKVAPVWAYVAETDGSIDTREGVTHYKAGDYIVYNDPEGRDGWAMSPETFNSLYDPVD